MKYTLIPKEIDAFMYGIDEYPHWIDDLFREGKAEMIKDFTKDELGNTKFESWIELDGEKAFFGDYVSHDENGIKIWKPTEFEKYYQIAD